MNYRNSLPDESEMHGYMGTPVSDSARVLPEHRKGIRVEMGDGRVYLIPRSLRPQIEGLTGAKLERAVNRLIQYSSIPVELQNHSKPTYNGSGNSLNPATHKKKKGPKGNLPLNH